jgi:hypothetical protein
MKKTRFCVTIVQTFADEYAEEGCKEFCRQLLDLGATDDIITKLVTNNSVYWYDEDNTQCSIIAAELLKDNSAT